MGSTPLSQCNLTILLYQELTHATTHAPAKIQGQQGTGKAAWKIDRKDLKQTNRFISIDALIPLPLFPSKEKKRGYNQATLLCEGISEVMNIEVLTDVVVRTRHTETQTQKGRMERWLNMEGKFELVKPERIQDCHLLLIDDVITTGATLEACGQELVRAPGSRLSIATLCFASR